MKNKGIALVEVLIVVAIIALLAVIFLNGYQKERIEMPRAYKAWVKHTGNTNNLTFEEWRDLVRVGQKHDTTIIFVPH